MAIDSFYLPNPSPRPSLCRSRSGSGSGSSPPGVPASRHARAAVRPPSPPVQPDGPKPRCAPSRHAPCTKLRASSSSGLVLTPGAGHGHAAGVAGSTRRIPHALLAKPPAGSGHELVQLRSRHADRPGLRAMRRIPAPRASRHLHGIPRPLLLHLARVVAHRGIPCRCLPVQQGAQRLRPFLPQGPRCCAKAGFSCRIRSARERAPRSSSEQAATAIIIDYATSIGKLINGSIAGTPSI